MRLTQRLALHSNGYVCIGKQLTDRRIIGSVRIVVKEATQEAAAGLSLCDSCCGMVRCDGSHGGYSESLI